MRDHTWSRQKNWAPHAPDTNHMCIPIVSLVRLGGRLCLCQESALKRAEENNQSLLWEEGKSPHTGKARELSSFPQPMVFGKQKCYFCRKQGRRRKQRGEEGERQTEDRQTPFAVSTTIFKFMGKLAFWFSVSTSIKKRIWRGRKQGRESYLPISELQVGQ